MTAGTVRVETRVRGRLIHAANYPAAQAEAFRAHREGHGATGDIRFVPVDQPVDGVPVHCEHSETTICSRCPAPLHCLIDADGARQFDDAGSLVAYQRARYDAQRPATRAAWAARIEAQA